MALFTIIAVPPLQPHEESNLWTDESSRKSSKHNNDFFLPNLLICLSIAYIGDTSNPGHHANW